MKKIGFLSIIIVLVVVSCADEKSIQNEKTDIIPSNLPGFRLPIEKTALLSGTILSAIALEECKVTERSSAHISTASMMADGETIEGGGNVTYAQCTQSFRVIKVMAGYNHSGRKRILSYRYLEKSDGFPDPAAEQPIPVGFKVFLMLDSESRIIKALADTPGNREMLEKVLRNEEETVKPLSDQEYYALAEKYMRATGKYEKVLKKYPACFKKGDILHENKHRGNKYIMVRFSKWRTFTEVMMRRSGILISIDEREKLYPHWRWEDKD